MRAPISTLIVAVAAAIAVTATPIAAQHRGSHGGSGHSRGGHASGGATHRGTHASGSGHAARRAVPHVSVRAPHIDHRTTVVVPSHRGHVGGLGAFGLGFSVGAYGYPFAYSRYNYSRYNYGYSGYYASSPGYYGGYARSGHARLRILDAPRDAHVIVDGVYVGIVDDFDGRFQHLELTPGVHQIEIRARGFAPIVFDVNAIDGRTITYRAHLLPNQP